MNNTVYLGLEVMPHAVDGSPVPLLLYSSQEERAAPEMLSLVRDLTVAQPITAWADHPYQTGVWRAPGLRSHFAYSDSDAELVVTIAADNLPSRPAICREAKIPVRDEWYLWLAAYHAEPKSPYALLMAIEHIGIGEWRPWPGAPVLLLDHITIEQRGDASVVADRLEAAKRKLPQYLDENY